MSQSISSDRISESSILRAAGNIVGHDVSDWLPGGSSRAHAVRAAVATARMLASEVQLTGPVMHVPLDAVLEFVRGLRDSTFDAHSLSTAADPAAYIAARLDEHFTELSEHLQSGAVPPLEALDRLAGPGGTYRVPLVRSGAEPVDDGGEGAALLRLDLPDSKTAERRARDLLLRLGVAGRWSSGDLVELANLFAQVDRLQADRAGDQQRLLHYEGAFDTVTKERDDAVRQLGQAQEALAQRRRDEDAPAPDGALSVPVQVCLGCNQQTRVRGDCGCPAGTGTREVPAISEAEYRQKAKAVRAALLGPDVKDPGHPPTAEMAKALRLGYEQQVRRGAAQDAQVADLRLEINRLSGVAQKCGDEREELRAHLRDVLTQLDALRGMRPGEQRVASAAAAAALRRSAEEIENSLRTPVVPDRELLLNCMRWYRAQADSLDPGHERLREEVAAFTRQPHPAPPALQCPSCKSPDRARHPAVQHGGEVQPCPDPWHGVPRDARLFAALAGGRRGGKADGLRQTRFDGCPVCNAWEDGLDFGEMLRTRGVPDKKVDEILHCREPHMAACEALGVPHNHEDIR